MSAFNQGHLHLLYVFLFFYVSSCHTPHPHHSWLLHLEQLCLQERQGIFFERPLERIHLPDPAEVTSDKLKKR
jgi:hypothetical protein